MPLSNRAMVQILLDEANNVEQLFPGYRKELQNTVATICKLERGHRVQATNVQVKMRDAIEATARLLVSHRRSSKDAPR